MENLKKAIKLYKMMGERFEESGLAPHQAKIYREMAEYISDCKTVQDASDKIKDSKYYLGLGGALLQDKLGVLERAARENQMDQVADIYKEKILAIDRDINEIYETGHELTGQNLKKSYMETLEAFSSIFDSYLTLSCASIIDDVTIRGSREKIKEDLKKLVKPSSDFTYLANLPIFRDLIPFDERGFATFVKAISQLDRTWPDYSEEKSEIQEELEKTIGLLEDEKVRDEVIEKGRANWRKIRRSQVLVVAPESKGQAYNYIDEEVADFD